jgi:hypothetical protein
MVNERKILGERDVECKAVTHKRGVLSGESSQYARWEVRGEIGV